MFSSYNLLVVTIALVLSMSTHFAAADSDVINVHGSGTTNPSKCIWKLMGMFMAQSKILTHMTYRAVGSTTGIKEFLGDKDASNPDTPLNDFGAGDVPVSNSQYKTLTSKGIDMLHIPFVLGSISFFHNIPNVPEGSSGLNVTGCLLAKIFDTSIRVWDHPDIIKINPHLADMLPSTDYPISVGRRVEGSSSTASITKYLYESCVEEWPKTKVGKVINWDKTTMECQGSQGMTDCIRDNKGAIGYMDSGHGWKEKLTEIELENNAGTYLSSKQAKERDGIASAAANAKIPSSAEENFGNVHLINMNGTNTWPIVAMSYIYVRKNFAEHQESEKQAGLVKLFLQSLFDTEYISECDEFGFTQVPDDVRNTALAGIESVDFGGVEWIFEKDTAAYKGAGPYVISSKRKVWNSADDNTNVAVQKNDQTSSSNDDSNSKPALIMSIISIVLWGCALILFLFTKLGNKKEKNILLSEESKNPEKEIA